MMPTCTLIETNNVTKIYNLGKIQVVALSGITLSVGQGWFLGIAGPSGSGKSTLMNLLAGLDTPSSGTIAVQGKFISQLSKDELTLFRRCQVGMIFQSFNLIASYTALENVAFPSAVCRYTKKTKKPDRSRNAGKSGIIHP